MKHLLAAMLFVFPAYAQDCKIQSQHKVKDPNRLLPEISGIVPSKAHDGVFWVHNDSKGLPAIYGLNVKGEIVATIEVSNAVNDDWEDITLMPCDQGHCIVIGDIGNGSRTEFQIYQIPEPSKLGYSKAKAEKYSYRYPKSEAFNAEGLAYADGLYVIRKGSKSTLFKFPKKLRAEMIVDPVCDMRTSGIVTGMDMRDDKILIKTTSKSISEYSACDELWREDYSSQGYKSKRGEAIAYYRDGFVSIAEGHEPRLYVFTCR